MIEDNNKELLISITQIQYSNKTAPLTGLDSAHTPLKGEY